ncbi:hypothetical protein BV22DRAFT_1051197 [Leucogyrophana mollusca]|uniref:Uncharacterized protein n=1 Tax=Leucogyrophana mollusca TaxID=85980 RepID=A0ACB8B049_9AGAM|nr:hypothetical protein BV22DRAFT_1051197 [Leucogyrophana mollusca]
MTWMRGINSEAVVVVVERKSGLCGVEAGVHEARAFGSINGDQERNGTGGDERNLKKVGKKNKAVKSGQRKQINSQKRTLVYQILKCLGNLLYIVFFILLLLETVGTPELSPGPLRALSVEPLEVVGIEPSPDISVDSSPVSEFWIGICTGKPTGVPGPTRTRTRQNPYPQLGVRVRVWVSTRRRLNDTNPFQLGCLESDWNVSPSIGTLGDPVEHPESDWSTSLSFGMPGDRMVHFLFN